MRRKAPGKTEPIVEPQILQRAKRDISPDRVKKSAKCSVCGAEVPNPGNESLCWVCRRLKISAWREIEQQMPTQE
jgi:hypothetical protein